MWCRFIKFVFGGDDDDGTLLRRRAPNRRALARFLSVARMPDECKFLRTYTPIGRKGIRFLFRNLAAEPLISRALAREFVGVTQKDPETPSGDPGRVFFSA